MNGSLKLRDDRLKSGRTGLRWRPAWIWPDEAEEKIREELETCPPPVLHVCSGSSTLGDVTVDLHHPRADIRADGTCLPLPDGSVGTVLIDPPWTINSAYERQKFVTEAGRVLRTGGVFLIYASWGPGIAWAELEEVWYRHQTHRLPHPPVLLMRWRKTGTKEQRLAELERRGRRPE